MARLTALVVCPDCYNHRFQGPVFAVEYKGPDEEHPIQCEFHGEMLSVVLSVVTQPEALD